MITTERLTLRALQGSDAGWIAREVSNPAVQRWLTSPPHPYRLADAEGFIAKYAANPWFRVIQADGAAVGVVSVGNAAEMDPQRAAADELGYWLCVDAHGHGYMTEAAGAMVDAFFRSGAKEIESGWVDGNEASENVLRKLGFARTGVVVQRRVNYLNKELPIVRVHLPRDVWHRNRH